MDCSACGERLADGAAFCHRCGARQAAPACASCAAELIPGAAFCAACGQPTGLSASVGTADGAGASAERRLTSVLFADLVSYTTLSEQRDTEDVRELLSAYFEVCTTVIRRYGGTVEKFIGDAVMAVWGVPVAMEDDAERAVRAGLELVAQTAGLGERLGLDELALRVGIVTGEVAANLAARDQGIVAGDPVNTAARIQSVAGAGEVLVDAVTRSLTVSAVAYTDAGEHVLKGKVEPVRLHRAESVVASIGGAQRVDGLEAPLVGRERELRLLKELFHGIEETRRPHLVVLDGEAGIGKSRLGWELEKYADGLTSTVRWHRGRCLSYGDGVAFWALAEAVRPRIGVIGNEGSTAVLAGLDGVLDAQVPDEEERRWMRPRVASLLGEESREFAREDLFAAWTRFFERVAATDPLVLVLEDAEHLDDGLADYVDFLVTNGTFPCFVLVLARPELLAARPHLGGRRSTPIRLEPLPDHAMSKLVDGLVEGLPDDVRQGLVLRAEGIPLYAVETVRALIDRDLVVPVEGRYVVAPDRTLDLSTIGPPASLHALVAARLDALAPAERRLLSDASVLGETFTREGVGILAAGLTDLDDLLAALVRKQLIAVGLDRFSTERGNYRFVQSVVRQVSYSTLSRRDRRTRHLAVADHLAADTERADEIAQVIARHLLDAAEASGAQDAEAAELRARAGDLLQKAGQRAEGLGAYADAGRSYAAAMECVTEPVARARLLRRLAEVHSTQTLYEESLACAQEAVQLFDAAGEAVEAAEATALESWALSGMDRTNAAVDVVRERLAALEEAGDRDGLDPVRARLLTALSGGLLFTGRPEESHVRLQEALPLLNRVADPKILLHTCNILALHHLRGGSRAVALMLFQGIAERALRAEVWLSAMIAIENASVLQSSEDLTEAVRLLDQRVEISTQHGFVLDDVTLTNTLNYTWLAGQWHRTTETLSQVASWPHPLNLSSRIGVAVAALLRWSGIDAPVTILMPEGEYEGAFPGTQEYAAGAVALAEGDTDAASARLCEAVIREVASAGLSDDLHVFWPVAIRAGLATEDFPADLHEIQERILAEAPSSSSLTGNSRILRALLADRRGADTAAVEADLREGIAILGRCGQRPFEAHAQEDLGRWLLGQGRAEEAQKYLAAAGSTYSDLGAVNWLARVQALLAPTVVPR